MTMAAVFIATLAISIINVPEARALIGASAYVSPYESGPKKPGDSFSVDVAIKGATGVRAFQFTLSWNPKILRVDSTTPVTEGPFLPSIGPTVFVHAIGVAAQEITVGDVILGYAWADGSGTLATVKFNVIGGGQTDLGLSVTLLDADLNTKPVTVTGGHFWSPFPFVDFEWFVPTPVSSGDKVNVTGISHTMITDASGNPAAITGPPYSIMRPVLHLDPVTGIPAAYNNVMGGTMFFGDKIKFDASGSYIVNGSVDPNTGLMIQYPLPGSAFHWVLRAGGSNTIRGYRSIYESGVELPTAAAFSYTFPGTHPKMYTYYTAYLGWFDLNLTVTDPATGSPSVYYTWIRIFRLSPSRTVMTNIPAKHVHVGDTMLIGGKVQDRAGTNYWPWTILETYMSLGRQINGFDWTTVKFTIYDMAGNKVATLYSDAVYLGGTETPNDPVYATWKVPNLAPGMYTVYAKGLYCGTGIGYGLSSTGTLGDWFEVLP